MKTERRSNSGIWIYPSLIIIICIILLSFHIIPSEPTIIAKKTLTFEKTFITKDDQIDMLDQLYFGSPLQKSRMNNNSVVKAIKDSWEVYETDDSRIFKNKDGGMTIFTFD